MADIAAQVTLFEEPDDYVIENNPDVTYTKVLDKFDFNLFQNEEPAHKLKFHDLKINILINLTNYYLYIALLLIFKLIYAAALKKNFIIKPWLISTESWPTN